MEEKHLVEFTIFGTTFRFNIYFDRFKERYIKLFRTHNSDIQYRDPKDNKDMVLRTRQVWILRGFYFDYFYRYENTEKEKPVLVKIDLDASF